MLSDLAQKLQQEIESRLPDLEKSFPKRELELALEAVARRLNLVIREEFEAQTAVLLRTRQLLESLEEKCAQLEAEIKK